ncbi:peptidase S8/S53 domain-containing protein [Syncephalis pseudoplumigaleata]|uniref:Peptidase S8/S53 domain-containing protein n=1 Tax=Syncephalis pseudoplumigaleata TaxID=1712513 RepID=A0A4P9Z1B3_9FUNG|nr:peptidase S8/S53 domain-containing protein [Syncephalis pseudoplumigaleata]|eukprot:RKP26267.1 peptidase S8/S53 domain-containing protein [Syncephalis pseudoplumigaleata]
MSPRNYEISASDEGISLLQRALRKTYPPMVPHLATGVSAVKAAGCTGKGVRIGIIDSGVDYDHPALGGGFGEGYKVAYGHDYVGDRYGETGQAVAGPYPRDCSGHGTAVAGVIAGHSRGFVGVAHEATLGAYRVISCTPHTVTLRILKKALALADENGMHIVTLSFGVSRNDDVKFLEALEDVHRKNIIVVAAVGNPSHGHNLAWASKLPASSPHAISVGVMDLRYKEQGYFRMLASSSGGVSDISIPYGIVCGSMEQAPSNVALAVVHPSQSQECAISTDVRGKAAFIATDECSITSVVEAAQTAGAVVAVVGKPRMRPSHCPMPVLFVDSLSLATMRNFAAKHASIQLGFMDGKLLTPDTRPILNDIHTTWGPSFDLKMNPDILAPGRMMFTTAHKPRGYQIIDGSSFAAPYVAASAALFLQARSRSANGIVLRYDPNRFKRLLMRSATPYTMPGLPLAGPVPQQGAGMLRIDAALRKRAPLTVTPLAIELGDVPMELAQKLGKRATITIANDGDTACSYTIGHLPSVSTRIFDDHGDMLTSHELSSVHAEAAISQAAAIQSSTVRVEPRRSLAVPVTFTIPATLAYKDRWLYSGYIVVDPSGTAGMPPSADAVYIPYLGLSGDLIVEQQLVEQSGKMSTIDSLLRSVQKLERRLQATQQAASTSRDASQKAIRDVCKQMKGKLERASRLVDEISSTHHQLHRHFHVSPSRFQPRLQQLLQQWQKHIWKTLGDIANLE